MKIIDLSHSINETMTVFPESPSPILDRARNINEHGFAVTVLTMTSHIGTHIDAPSHMVEGKNNLDDFSVDQFIGKALIIDVSAFSKSEISKDYLLKYEENIKDIDFVIFKTGWSKYWSSERYFEDFPVLSQEAAKWISDFELKGIGVDAISVDTTNSEECPVHKTLMNKNIILIENLTNLDKIESKSFLFQCLSLKYIKADGSPVRSVGITDL